MEAGNIILDGIKGKALRPGGDTQGAARSALVDKGSCTSETLQGRGDGVVHVVRNGFEQQEAENFFRETVVSLQIRRRSHDGKPDFATSRVPAFAGRIDVDVLSNRAV